MKYILILISSFIIVGCWSPKEIQQDATINCEMFIKHDSHATSCSCVGRDSELDGWVSCSVFSQESQPYKILCGYGYWKSRGCKLPTISW